MAFWESKSIDSEPTTGFAWLQTEEDWVRQRNSGHQPCSVWHVPVSTCPNLTVYTLQQEVSLLANERLWVAMICQHGFLDVMKVNFDGDADSERWQGSPEIGQEIQATNPGILHNFSRKLTSTKPNSKWLQTLKEALSLCLLPLPVWKGANLHCYVRGWLCWLNFRMPQIQFVQLIGHKRTTEYY